MAFRMADFKKTTRKDGDTRRLYPYQIRDERYTAAIGYAIAYFERMVGRRRAEFETETLLEFFGDTRLARGLVACLSRTYSWREQTLAEAFGSDLAQNLRAADLTPHPLPSAQSCMAWRMAAMPALSCRPSGPERWPSSAPICR